MSCFHHQLLLPNGQGSFLVLCDQARTIISSVESLSHVQLFVTSWIAARKVGLKLNIQKTKIMASGPIIFIGNRWGNSGNSVRLYFSGLQIIADGGCSHEIKRCLLLGRKVMTNLDSIFKSRGIALPIMVHLVKAMIFLWSCMDVRVRLWRRLSTEELMLLNSGVGEDSWESLGLQGDPTSPFWRRSALGFLWKE